MKKIKIVIPTYNRVDYLKYLLAEIGCLPEMDDRISIVVVDDFSEQVLRNQIKNLSNEYPSVQFMFSKCNTGGAVVRNLGANSFSESDWIWFFDDDDFVEYDKVVKVINYLEEVRIRESLLLLNAQVKARNGSIKLITPVLTNLFQKYRSKGHDVNTSCTIIKTDLFKEVGGWDENLVAGQDTDLFLRLSIHTNAETVAGVSVFVNQEHEVSITKNPKKQLIGKLQFLKKHYHILSLTRAFRYFFTIIVLYPYWKR